MIRYQGLQASQKQPKGDLCPVGDSAASLLGTAQKQKETGFIPLKKDCRCIWMEQVRTSRSGIGGDEGGHCWFS